MSYPSCDWQYRTDQEAQGHAIGLEHEHSRPDASEYVWFYCENLADYDEVSRPSLFFCLWKSPLTFAQVKAKIQPPDTIEDACKSRETALRYQFSAWAYLPNPNQGVLGQNAWSIGFDRDSIMIYGSYDGGKELPSTDRSLGKPVLLGHGPDDKDPNSGTRYKIYMGGSSNKAYADISSGDTARVAQLYPPKEPEDADNAGANDPDWQGTSIAIAKRNVKTAILW